jgi:hypothetical protein
MIPALLFLTCAAMLFLTMIWSTNGPLNVCIKLCYLAGTVWSFLAAIGIGRGTPVFVYDIVFLTLITFGWDRSNLMNIAIKVTLGLVTLATLFGCLAYNGAVHF